MNTQASREWLLESIAEARLAFPEIGQAAIDEEELARFLASKVSTLPDPSLFRQLKTKDLYLAFACARNAPESIRLFEELHFPAVKRTLTRTKLDADAINDVVASLREELFFSSNNAKSKLIETYSGRGDLVSWLRSIAIRMASRRKKTAGRHVPEATLADFASAANPELQYLRRAHADLFEQALLRVLESLGVRERNLLRQHYLDGLTVDALGQLYNIHRATAARWVADARERVLDGVKSELSAKMSPSEIESFLRATRDELDLRISRVLRVSKSV
jgi:RNA polymerase sigma-70 factor, ECF subfamily